jgi:hypothetical protein
MRTKASPIPVDPISRYERAIRDEGWFLLPSLLPGPLVARLARALDEVSVDQRAMHQKWR